MLAHAEMLQTIHFAFVTTDLLNIKEDALKVVFNLLAQKIFHISLNYI